MAVKRSTRRPGAPRRRKPAQKVPAKYLFWLVFIFLVTCLFLLNWRLIRRTVTETGFLDRLLRREREDTSFLTEPALPPEPAAGAPDSGAPPQTTPPRPAPPVSPPAAQPPAQPAPAASPPAAVPPPRPPAEPPAQPAARPAQPAEPAARPAPPPVQPAPPAAQPATRYIYLMRVDRDGAISRSPAARTLPVSDSPMLDALNALLQGPTEAEARAGLRSLIPAGTRILSAYVRDSTAYISFSEEFQFNPYGAEGWASQVRQVVWTATEFSTVKNVQILIEGRRIGYLGETLWVGDPLSRDDL